MRAGGGARGSSRAAPVCCLQEGLSKQYAQMVPSLAALARSMVRDLDPQVRWRLLGSAAQRVGAHRSASAASRAATAQHSSRARLPGLLLACLAPCSLAWPLACSGPQRGA